MDNFLGFDPKTMHCIWLGAGGGGGGGGGGCVCHGIATI